MQGYPIWEVWILEKVALAKIKGEDHRFQEELAFLQQPELKNFTMANMRYV